MPAFLVHDHLDINVARENLGLDFLFRLAVLFDHGFGRNADVEDLIAQSSVLDDLLQTGFDFVFVARIGVRNIPPRTYIHFIDITHGLTGTV